MWCADDGERSGGFEEIRRQSRRRGRRARNWWHIPLATVVLVLAVAVPAQANPTVYVGGSSGNVFQYGVSPVDGSLSPLSDPTVATGQHADHVAVSPNGQSVYVTTSGGVAQYDVSNAGLLSPKVPATVPGAAVPMGIVVTPDSNSVYVASVDGTIFQYDVGAGGGLSPKNPATVPTIAGATGLAVSPDGSSVYVSITGTGAAVYQLSVGASETLSPKNPATVAADEAPSSVTVSPDGNSVYVTNRDSDTISQYDVGSGGTLAPKSAGEVGTGEEPSALVVSPDGESAYVINAGDGSVSQYGIGAGGVLAPKQPNSVSGISNPAGVAVSPDGESVYVTGQSSGGGAVDQFDVGGNGTLSPKSPASVATGTAPTGIAVRPSFATTTVKFAYTGAVQSWTVPAGVTSATFDVYGAQGGSSYPSTQLRRRCGRGWTRSARRGDVGADGRDEARHPGWGNGHQRLAVGSERPL